MAVREHNTIREGICAGMLSATAIAIWLLIVDTIQRRPFFTPDVLGSGLLRFLGAPRMSDTMALHVGFYTVFHYISFAIIGVIVAWIVHQARRTPAILAGFLIMFVVVEFGFYGLAAMLSANSVLGGIAWYQIMVANLLASLVMFTFMWMRHPELKGQFAEALEGKDA
ncbi:MAG TPA: hypothetical protein VII66_06235 [Gemmatimonadaceae bacterium]